ncbi:MAG: tRNA 2-thiouridine(34) synthase MnmA [Patescibacteria group bacterium]
MKSKNSTIKVAVGMSGGVDSSVSAMLLKEAGYDVIGVFLKFWFDSTCNGSRENACCNDQALIDARAVADKIGIPLYTVDAREPFKKEVTDYFVDEYKNLRTPNPCVVCNKKIKFGWFLDFAEKLGCDFVATGHYARIARGNSSSIKGSVLSIKHNTEYKIHNTDTPLWLLKGVAPAKDQSYFLYQLDQRQLSKILFPVGEMTKVEVRALAKKYDLPVFEKVESQEVCFIQDEDYRGFLHRHLGEKAFKPGNIVGKEGNIIGKHEGLINYTIGQRRGIDQSRKQKAESKKPLYVTGFDVEKNELIVGNNKELFRDEFTIEKACFSTKFEVLSTEKMTVKIRYQAEAVSCIIEPIIHNTKYLIRLSSPQRAITPGQSAVFYDSDRVVGGGIIS